MSMRLAFVADGRSPHARSWLGLFTARGHEVHLISTFRCEPPPGLATYTNIPVAFSRFTRDLHGGEAPGGAPGIQLRAALRHWLGPLTIPAAANRLRQSLATIEPEIVHALRVPFEGMLAAAARPAQPLVMSVWGNDFTLHASSTPFMASSTRTALRRADGLHTDCARDARLARAWGFPPARPVMILPGSGGVHASIFHPGQPELRLLGEDLRSIMGSIQPQAPVVVNPRGFRAYVRNDTFFKAIPLILREEPGTIVLCPAMAGIQEAETWVNELGVQDSVYLLPRLEPAELAAIYQRSWVMISPSEHDGTPNTFLEAIACGCYPVVSDLESLREWITHGENGTLTSASDAHILAGDVIQAIRSPALRNQARATNLALIERRAARESNADRAEAFYQGLLGKAPGRAAGVEVEIGWP
jgi:glycosyltransferase involved in cell wall biosynthesis